jgi:hypothetical protein
MVVYIRVVGIIDILWHSIIVCVHEHEEVYDLRFYGCECEMGVEVDFEVFCIIFLLNMNV